MMSTPRIEKLREGLQVEKYPICTEKARLMTEIFRRTEGEPQILRRAKALAYSLDNITIFIRNGELIVGNGASTYMEFHRRDKVGLIILSNMYLKSDNPMYHPAGKIYGFIRSYSNRFRRPSG